MSNYEQFKNLILSDLQNHYSAVQLVQIEKAIDRAAYNYEITQKETDLIPYGSEAPELVKVYIASRKIEGVAESTLYNYAHTLKNFFQYVMKAPEDITTLDIRMFLYTYQQDRGISDRSLDHVRINVCTFFTWCSNEGYITTNPGHNVKQIHHEKKQRRALSQIELEYVRRSCRTKRETAMIEVLYSSGCRISELIGIKLTDLDMQEKKVHLFGKGKKHRDSFLNGKAEVAIMEYLQERKGDSDYLFTSDRAPYGNLSKAGAEKIIKNISERSGVVFTPHVLRHTSATTAMNNGMPVQSVQAYLGHENINTTMVYAHTDMAMVQSQHKHSVI